MANQEVKAFLHSVHNLVSDEIIPNDASQDAKNWIAQDAKLQLIPGKIVIGANGVAGKITGEIFGYKSDGTKVHWRKKGTVIQYFDGTTWQDVITGLTSAADYSFTNYSSLAGTFTFAIGIDGIFKMHNANPGSYKAMYNSAKNFKGLAFIDRGRMILWNRPEDKTGLYGSKIDPQNSTVYTSVANEVLGTGDGVQTVFTGTLAQATGTRNVFALALNMNPAGITATDNFLGVISGTGVSGTINYLTGAYSLTFTSPVAGATQVRMSYQYEDSNTGGVTDFTKSATRLAGEGFVFPQDEGGDAIKNVLIGFDGYYSLKSQSSYRLALDPDDLGADNNPWQAGIGLLSYRGAIASSLGIIFMNTANPEKPEMTILQKNAVGDALVPKVLFTHFKFSDYTYDDCTMYTYDRYILVACKSSGATNNDTLLLCNVAAETVDITGYAGRTFASSAGLLYMGSSIVESVYNLFSGFDDDGFLIDNFWIGKGETWGSENLKKYRKLWLKGDISPDQYYEVYISYDDAGFQLVGTVLGSGSYVDYATPQSIGSNFIGSVQIGGDVLTNIYPYFLEIRLKKVPKFRKRTIKFVAKGYGYVSVAYQLDKDIEVYEGKIPSRFRQKQNVSLDGTQVDQPHPEF